MLRIDLVLIDIERVPFTKAHGPQTYLAHQRGMNYCSQGKYAQAIQAFTTALQYSPECALAIHNRGVCLYSLNHFDAAIADFTHAHSLNIEIGEEYSTLVSHYCLAHAYLDNSIRAESIWHFTLAIEKAESLYEEELLIDAKDKLQPLLGLYRDKETIFEDIKKLPYRRRLDLLTKCQDKNTLLGQRFLMKDDYYIELSHRLKGKKNILEQVADYSERLQSVQIMWFYLLGPKLVKENKISSDVFLYLTSSICEVSFQSLQEHYAKANNLLFFKEVVKDDKKNDELPQLRQNISR